MAKVYLHAEMKHTIFQQPNTRSLMENSGIAFTSGMAEADLLIANHVPLLQEFISKECNAQKKFMLWTHEPRFWQDSRQEALISGKKVRIVSLYSGEVFRDNYYYAKIREGKFTASRATSMRSRKVVCVARAFQSGMERIRVDGKAIDLVRLRSNIALHGHGLGVLDIYGSHWPRGVSLGVSRHDPMWSLKKYELLQPYGFNLCFENTCWPYYCSEKMWHSIYCGCLPIYFGQPSIYEDFSESSFIDYAKINEPNALFEMIAVMSEAEYVHRYNLCFEVLQHAIAKGDSSRIRAAEYIVHEIKRMIQPVDLVSIDGGKT